MTEDLRPIRILNPVGFNDEWVTFAATDTIGPLLIRFGRLGWERLQADAPDLCADDRRDYALGMIEIQAAGIAAIVTPEGRQLTIRPH